MKPAALACGLLVLLAWQPSSQGAFLSDKLPLQVILTTPVQLLSSDSRTPVELQGQQAISVVFSRPVIALGEDFGTSSSGFASRAPFMLSCSRTLPGKARWATTTIARFDADVPWPTDLDCTFSFNTSLTAYDGAVLQAGNLTSHRLITQPLSADVQAVGSQLADDLTAGFWSGTTGVPGQDKLPEVPPGGNVTLQFNYPVDLQLLQSALALDPVPEGQLQLNLSRCFTPAPWAQPASSSVVASSDDACVVVSNIGPLRPDTGYELVLPEGSRYSRITGPTTSRITIFIAGLRRFRLPIRQNFQKLTKSGSNLWDATKYRRLSAWLPHGLKPGVRTDLLVAQMHMCEVTQPFTTTGTSPCNKVDIASGQLLQPALLQLQVPAFQPRRLYRISVVGNSEIRDGFDLPLEGSSGEFWTQDLEDLFTGSSVYPYALFEPGSLPRSWPYLARGTGGPSLSSAAVWRVSPDGQEDVRRLVQVLTQGDVLVNDVLGAPYQQVSRGTAADATLLELHLDATKSVHVVSQCCYQVSWPSSSDVSSNTQLILATSISATWVVSTGQQVVVWVTGTTSNNLGPAQGATAYLYSASSQEAPSLVGQCTTDSAGVCSVPMPAPDPSQGLQLVGVVQGPAGDVFYSPNVGYWTVPVTSLYVGALVLDRALVRPGDKLHVTGYVSQKAGSRGDQEGQQGVGQVLRPANVTQALLVISPGWEDPQKPIRVLAAVNPDYGSLHTAVQVPDTAKASQYQVTLYVSPTNELPAAPSPPPTVTPAPPDNSTGGGDVVHRVSGRVLKFMGPAAANPVPPLITTSSSSSSSSSRQLLDAVAGAAVAHQVHSTQGPADQGFDPTGLLSLASQQFTVSDPRSPTADLIITAPAWAPPTSDVRVTLEAVSYLGNQVAGASLDVTWTTSKAQGTVNVSSDGNGTATALIPLSSLPPANVSQPGDRLQVVVTWIGPTRERIVRDASIRLEGTARRVDVRRTLDTAVPGVVFGVYATLTSNEDNSDLPGVPLLVTLKPNASAGADCTTTATCNIASGNSTWGRDCQLSLPCQGSFILEVCSQDQQQPPACANTSLGRNTTSWALAPLAQYDVPTLTANATEYKLGGWAGLSLQLPWRDTSALLVWGNTEQPLRSKLVTGLQPGLVTLSLPLGQECVGGCGVVVLLSVPRSPGPVQLGVPVSRLFDPGAPHSHVLSTTLTVTQELALDVQVAVDTGSTTTSLSDQSGVAVIAPGDNTTVSVVVTQAGSPVSDAEVTLIAVDKGVLDLLPYPQPNLLDTLVLSLAASLSASETERGARVAAGAVPLVFSTLMRRLALDPWLPAATTVSPPYWLPSTSQDATGWVSAVDMNDTLYLQQYDTPITYMPSRSWVCYGGVCAFSQGGAQQPLHPGRLLPSVMADGAAQAAAVPTGVASMALNVNEAAGSEPTPSAATAQYTPRLTSLFTATPLFDVVHTASDGRGAATFTAPANPGTFVLRAYAVRRGQSGYGVANTSLVVRRPVSLTAALPRQVHPGDVFLGGVLVTAPGLPPDAAPFDVSIRLVVLQSLTATTNPLLLLGPDSVTVTLTGAQPQLEARFEFNATQLGNATLVFTASDAQGHSDVLQTQLAVLPGQLPVFVATSFALSASSTNNTSGGWQEGLQLPAAQPGSGSLDLVAGVGHLPAVVAATSAVAEQHRSTRPDAPLDGPTSLALAVIEPLMVLYRQKLTGQQLIDTSGGQASLYQLTDNQYGLLPFQPGAWSWTPTRADVLLNTRAAWLLTHLNRQLGSQKVSSSWEELSSEVGTWRVAAARQLVKDATDARYPSPGVQPRQYTDWLSIAWVRLALGADWQVPYCGTAQAADLSGVCTDKPDVQSDLSLDMLLNASPVPVLGVRVITALALQASGSVSQHQSYVAKVVDDLISSLRITGRTAYIASEVGRQTAAALETQTLALELLLAQGRQASQGQVLQKLAAYVASYGQSSDRPSFAGLVPPACLGPLAVAVSSAALASYDQQVGSTAPDVQLTAAVGAVTLLQAAFNSSTVSQPPVRSSSPWTRLPSSPASLLFSVKGKGEVSISVGASFVPLRPLTFPTYRGIWVESVLQATDPLGGQPTGPALLQAPVGTLLTGSIQVTTPDDLGAVTLTALMPGGLEPLDPALTSAAGPGAAAAPQCPASQWVGQDAWRAVRVTWWFPLCPAQEVRPASITWRWQRLPAGSHSVMYQVVAATQGNFQLPPITASVDEQPEVMGMTASSSFTVCAAGCEPAAAPATAALAQACPDETCSGHGSCNLAAGVCVCQGGWSGKTCNTAAAA